MGYIYDRVIFSLYIVNSYTKKLFKLLLGHYEYLQSYNIKISIYKLTKCIVSSCGNINKIN